MLITKKWSRDPVGIGFIIPGVSNLYFYLNLNSNEKINNCKVTPRTIGAIGGEPYVL